MLLVCNLLKARGLEGYINENLANRVQHSSYSIDAPIFIAKKKEKSTCLVLDYEELNLVAI